MTRNSLPTASLPLIALRIEAAMRKHRAASIPDVEPALRAAIIDTMAQMISSGAMKPTPSLKDFYNKISPTSGCDLFGSTTKSASDLRKSRAATSSRTSSPIR